MASSFQKAVSLATYQQRTYDIEASLVALVAVDPAPANKRPASTLFAFRDRPRAPSLPRLHEP
eukprot:5501771-Alexandrium_andersonii.AAC.1